MRFRAAATLTIVLFAAAWPLVLGAQPAPDASPAPSATPLPPAGPTPSPAPSSPAPVATATPMASPYHYVVTPPPPAAGQPAILEIDMLDQVVHVGGPYSVRVKTSPDVTALNVITMGGSYAMQAAGPGLFASDGQVPNGVPFFMLNRSYTVTIVASTADGRSTSVPISLRLER